MSEDDDESSEEGDSNEGDSDSYESGGAFESACQEMEDMLADTEPGDEVDITGFFRSYMEDGFFQEVFLPLFNTRSGEHEKFLELNMFHLSYHSIERLTEVLAQGQRKSLEILFLRNYTSANESMIDLLAVLPEACPVLKTIDLDCIFDDEGLVTALVDMMRKMKHLQVLSINRGSLTSKGWTALSKVLQHCQSLKKIEFETEDPLDDIDSALEFIRGMRRSRLEEVELNQDGMVNFSAGFEERIVRTCKLIQSEFPCMLALFSVNTVKRLGRRSSLRMLPVDLLRRLVPFLYDLVDLDYLPEEEEEYDDVLTDGD